MSGEEGLLEHGEFGRGTRGLWILPSDESNGNVI